MDYLVQIVGAEEWGRERDGAELSVSSELD
jgi:hypothetical protein